MVIEIKTVPNINGNCKRLFLHCNQYGAAEQITEFYDRLPAVSLQVTPRQYKEYADLKRRRDERAA